MENEWSKEILAWVIHTTASVLHKKIFEQSSQPTHSSAAAAWIMESNLCDSNRRRPKRLVAKARTYTKAADVPKRAGAIEYRRKRIFQSWRNSILLFCLWLGGHAFASKQAAAAYSDFCRGGFSSAEALFWQLACFLSDIVADVILLTAGRPARPEPDRHLLFLSLFLLLPHRVRALLICSLCRSKCI